MGLLVALNTINLIAGLYMFFITTAVLVNHNLIKKVSNKSREKDKSKPEITDFDIRLVGALFAYLTVYFFYNFGNMMWFGKPIL